METMTMMVGRSLVTVTKEYGNREFKVVLRQDNSEKGFDLSLTSSEYEPKPNGPDK